MGSLGVQDYEAGNIPNPLVSRRSGSLNLTVGQAKVVSNSLAEMYCSNSNDVFDGVLQNNHNGGNCNNHNENGVDGGPVHKKRVEQNNLTKNIPTYKEIQRRRSSDYNPPTQNSHNGLNGGALQNNVFGGEHRHFPKNENLHNGNNQTLQTSTTNYQASKNENRHNGNNQTLQTSTTKQLSSQ